MTDPQHEESFADTERKLREIITTLRAQLAEAHKDGFQLAAWQCLFEDGKTGIVCDDWGNQYCAMQRRADRAEAALAAQIEADAEKQTVWVVFDSAPNVNGHVGVSMKNPGNMGDRYVAAEYAPVAAIRNQPHDRTALDRHDAKTREKALREAAAACIAVSVDPLTKAGREHASWMKATAEDCSRAILAMIDKEKTK